MKKLASKLLCLIIALMLSFTLVSCKTDDSGNDGNDGGGDDGTTTEFYNPNEKEEVSLTNIVFVSNGVSDYKIVIPEGHNGKEVYEDCYAAYEIQYFVHDATGVTIPVIEDTEITGLDENAKYISIGDTKIYADSDMYGTLEFDVLGNDGIVIETYGNTVVANAFGLNGKLYTAYGFLERVMDWNYYAEDVWTMTEDDVIYMKDMSVVDIPTFQQRRINTGASDDPEYSIRMRQHGYSAYSQISGLGEAEGWVGSDMSIAYQFMKVTEHRANHPSWYYKNGEKYTGQPCLEAIIRNYTGNESQTEVQTTELFNEINIESGNGAFDVMMRTMINDYIRPNPKARIIMLGANDNVTPCQCATCLVRYAEVKPSGQYCMLANMVSDYFAEYQESLPEDDPLKHREVSFAFFAYLFAEESPTIYDEKTKTYTPINDDVVLNANVIARIAPIKSVNMHTHLEIEYNPGAAVAFESWNVISPRLAVWDYGCSFMDALVPYGDWGTLKENFLMYREKNVTEIFTQLQSRTSGYGLRALKIYRRAQLMWDLDQDIYELTDKFFENYYGKEAGKYMYNYYEFLQSVYQTFDYEKIETGDIYSTVISTPKCFSYNMTRKMGTFFEDALDAIAPLEATDKELYDKYYEHIHCERLFYDYLMIKNYHDYLIDSELNGLIDHFDYWRQIAGLRLLKIASTDTTYDGWAEQYRR